MDIEQEIISSFQEVTQKLNLLETDDETYFNDSILDTPISSWL